MDDGKAAIDALRKAKKQAEKEITEAIQNAANKFHRETGISLTSVCVIGEQTSSLCGDDVFYVRSIDVGFSF